MRILEDFISLFFPNFCLGCNRSLYKQERLVCAHCISEAAKTNTHLEHDNFIKRKFDGKIQVENAWSYFYFQKDGIAQNLIHHLKYENRPELGVELGKRYASVLKEVINLNKPDYIVPVPLHFKKLKKRGYNQSAEFAKGLSQVLEIPYLNGLERKIATETQTAKSRMQRWENVNTIFGVIDDSVVKKHILLVDDVITTGATIEACAQILIDAGCKVTIATLASVR
ncbi:ComF family protein [Fulvivirga lutea]|uniref:ComF family protein n=1 Tax=Fulvivirga lutea TaxID=2810512 RepID=A0A974WL17_9BACT|nr:ComF family protein [Fulvivirga lutea]QSE98150.1 ComF family protein [Fulvivirga lutea]